MSSTTRLSVAWFMAAWLCGFTAVAATEDTLTAAKELYATAAYQDALGMLDRLKAAEPSADDAVEIDKYRAFCMFAMGRTADAEQVVADILARRPRFRLDERDASPRVVAAFREVRKRQLPLLLEQAYTRGREGYDRKQTETAMQQFQLVLELADDADAPKDLQLLKDLRILASGFLNLAEARKSAAEPAPPPAPPPAPTPVTRPFYTAADADVTPPVVINQEMPPWPSDIQPVNASGILEILISEKGEVETAAIRAGMHPVFDALLLRRVKEWRYRPATLASRPVKYRKLIAIKVKEPGF